MKKIPYGRQWIDQDDVKAVGKALVSDFLTQGPTIKEFETRLCDFVGAKYAVVVSSGTAALHLACLAAGINKDDEAITSPITFLATSNAVLYAGGNPRFADVHKDSGLLDPQAVAKMINKCTKAILPVHLAGTVCDMETLSALARKNRLIVIEDACHALGAQYKVKGEWINVGSCRHSDMAVFSFHPVKHITTGEGGAICTNNKKLYEKLVMLREHGMIRDKEKLKKKNEGGWYYEMQDLGLNYRLTDMQCSLGISQLKRLKGFIQRRRAIVELYRQAFSDNPLFEVPVEGDNVRSAWHLFPIRLQKKYQGKRRAIFERLRELGIWVQVHYIPVYWQPYYETLGFKKRTCPSAEDYYNRSISLPIFPAMSGRDIEKVIREVHNVIRTYSK